MASTQKCINIITTKNTYIYLEVKEQPLSTEELERHTVQTSSGAKNEYQQQKHTVMERRNSTREQVAEQHLGEIHVIRRDAELTRDKNLAQRVDITHSGIDSMLPTPTHITKCTIGNVGIVDGGEVGTG